MKTRVYFLSILYLCFSLIKADGEFKILNKIGTKEFLIIQ